MDRGSGDNRLDCLITCPIRRHIRRMSHQIPNKVVFASESMRSLEVGGENFHHWPSQRVGDLKFGSRSTLRAGSVTGLGGAREKQRGIS